MRLFSPAKINLFLRVLRKREDGYHDLASLFQAIDLGDYLTFSLSSQDSLICTDPSLPCDGTNLIQKAVELFRKKTGLTFGIRIHLEKHIPIQSGLGGGSSNAATTLWGLNVLLGSPATTQQLASWAGEIGSDISFFLSQGSAYCTGRGEIVRDISPLTQIGPLWIVKPQEGLSTPLIFKNLFLERDCSNFDPEALLASFASSPNFTNDLEAPAFRVMPSLKTLKETLLEKGFSHATMTGSGTGFFCFGPKEFQMKEVFIRQASFISRPVNAWYAF